MKDIAKTALIVIGTMALIYRVDGLRRLVTDRF